jgi:sugar lactone lactonase YvrE
MSKRIVLVGLVGILSLLMLYLLFWPVPINPSAWTPPEAPALAGVYAPNTMLSSVERLGEGEGVGPEDVAIDAQGRVYGGFEDGRIMRFLPDGSQPELFADTEGRPLGLHFDAMGNLVVADAKMGLLLITPDGAIQVLSTGADGIPFAFTNDVDIAADGTIYFSDASFKFSIDSYTEDLMEHRPNGRLLTYDPETRTTSVVMDELYYANGVAISPDQTFVLVVEMGKYRVWRFWLSGSRSGQSEIFIENLPGFPDSISSNGRDTFWLALVSPRLEDVDKVMLPRPFLRKIIMRLPDSMLPAAENYGFVLGINLEGRVTHNLQDPTGSYAQITSVQEHGGILYLGSLVEDAIGRLPVPQ